MSNKFLKSKFKYHLKVKNGREIINEVNYDDRVIDVYGSGGVFKYTDRKLFAGPSVLFGRKGTIGKPLYVEGDFWTVDTMYYTEIYPGNSARYFYYLLEVFPWNRIVTQTALPSIVGSEVENYEINIPNENMQKVIAKYLDSKCEEINKLIIYKERLITFLEQQRQSIISEAVTKGLNSNVKMKDSGVEWVGEIPEHWQKTRIDFISRVKARLGWKGLKAEEYVEKGYGFLSTPNLKYREIDFKNINYITEERYLESPEIMLEIGDVLLAKDGSTLGIVNVVRDLPIQSTVNSSIAVLRPTKKINSVYFYYYLKSTYIQDVINQIKDGMGVPHLFQADIKKFKVLLPPLTEQQSIAKFLDEETLKIEKLIVNVKSQIDKLKEYRQALIYEAVTGKMDVREMEID